MRDDTLTAYNGAMADALAKGHDTSTLAPPGLPRSGTQANAAHEYTLPTSEALSNDPEDSQPTGSVCKTCDFDLEICVCDTPEEDSASEEEFDKMVASASVPTLASLFRQGVANGVISPQSNSSIWN